MVLHNGMAYEGTAIGGNSYADVGVLKIEAEGLVAAEIGSSSTLAAGDTVVLAGCPAATSHVNSITVGTVSHPNRLLYWTSSGEECKMRLIQTDAAINGGNSGGPLTDIQGRVVGIVMGKRVIVGDHAADGMGYCLPIDGVKAVADDIIQNGTATKVNPIAEGRSELDVSYVHNFTAGRWCRYSEMKDDWVYCEATDAGALYLPVAGMLVTESNGKNKLLLQAGDTITHVNGIRVDTDAEYRAVLDRYWSGEKVTVTVVRGATPTSDGTTLQLKVTVCAQVLY